MSSHDIMKQPKMKIGKLFDHFTTETVWMKRKPTNTHAVSLFLKSIQVNPETLQIHESG